MLNYRRVRSFVFRMEHRKTKENLGQVKKTHRVWWNGPFMWEMHHGWLFFHCHVWFLRWTWVQWPQSMRRQSQPHPVDHSSHPTINHPYPVLNMWYHLHSPWWGAFHVDGIIFPSKWALIKIPRRSQWACRMPCKASRVARIPWAFWHSLWLSWGMKDAVLAYFTANG
jgi:hypothetical protein